MPTIPKRNLQDELNRCMPAADHAKLGDLIAEMITKHNALLAKLDTDAGVGGTDYVVTLGMTELNNR